VKTDSDFAQLCLNALKVVKLKVQAFTLYRNALVFLIKRKNLKN